MNALVSGGPTQLIDQLKGGSECVIIVGRLSRDMKLFAYVTDLYDGENTAIWVDKVRIIADEACVRRSAYVIRTDGNSAFIDSAMSAILSQKVITKEIGIEGRCFATYSTM